MKTVEFTKDIKFSPDGITSIDFEKGEQVKLPEAAAQIAVKGEFAKLIKVDLTDKEKEKEKKIAESKKENERLKAEENAKKKKALGLKPEGKKGKGPAENK